MLDEEIIEEARKNFKIYINDGLIKKINFIDENILAIFLRNAQESLDLAEISNKDNISSMWTIVCSYYSMFYIANCLLYVNKYKVGGKIVHKVTSDSLIYLMRGKLKNYFLNIYKETEEEAQDFAQFKSDTLLENLNLERKKRSTYQYETPENIKHAKAETSLKRAKEFFFEIKSIIENTEK
jgi:uncharacterized protein (UPF0332 family)